MERKVSTKMAGTRARHRSVAADRAYLDALAQRLADNCRLPLALALKRVQKLAVSAQPKESYRRGGQ